MGARSDWVCLTGCSPGETVVRVECDADERYSRIPAGPARGPGEAMNTQELLCLEPRNHVLSSFGALDKGLQAPFRGHCAQLHPWQTTVSCGCGTDAVGIHGSCIQAAQFRRGMKTRVCEALMAGGIWLMSLPGVLAH